MASNTSRYRPAAGDPALHVNKIVVKQGTMINDVLEHMHEETGMLKYLYESSDEHIIKTVGPGRKFTGEEFTAEQCTRGVKLREDYVGGTAVLFLEYCPGGDLGMLTDYRRER